MADQIRLSHYNECILTSIVALSLELDHPLESYTAHLGRIRMQKFGIQGRGRGDVPKLPGSRR